MFLKTTRWQRRGWCGALAVTIACAIAEPAFAQKEANDATLASVFKDWQSRQSILKSARYVLTGTTEFKDKQLPPGNPIRPYRITLLLDLKRKRYRIEGKQDVIHALGELGKEKQEYHTRISTTAYDGEALQQLTHRRANHAENYREDDLSISKGNLGAGAQFGGEVWPIFFAHGIVPTVHSQLFVDKWPLTPDPDIFEVTGRQILRSQNCLLIRTEPLPFGRGSSSDEFWINPTQQSAIYRHIYFSSDSVPWWRLDISWKTTPSGWWVDRWSQTMYRGNRGERVWRIFSFQVESFEADPEVSDSDFKLPAEPGMIVKVSEGPPRGKGLDPFKGAITMYKISPTGAWEQISAKGFTTLEGEVLPPESGRRWIAWTVGGGAAIGALLFYVLRRQRKRAAA